MKDEFFERDHGNRRLTEICGVSGSSPGSRPTLFVSLAGCVLLPAVLAFSGLGARPLISPAEARYALVAREMLESGDWIQPHLNHARYYEKPPLTYWSVAASYRLFGFTEFASRLPSALAYIGTVLVTFLLARELVGSGTAPLSPRRGSCLCALARRPEFRPPAATMARRLDRRRCFPAVAHPDGLQGPG